MKKNSDIFGFIPQLCTLVRSFRSLSLHFAWSTIFSPSQWCLATIVRVTRSWDKMYRKMKMNVKNKLIHDISHVTQRLLIFSGRCNSLLRLQVSKFFICFSVPAWIIYSETNGCFGIFILLITWAIIEKRLFSCWSSTSQHFSLLFVYCQEIIAKLLITYPQQAMWMMMAVSKVNIRPALLAVILVCLFHLWFAPSPSFDYAC